MKKTTGRVVALALGILALLLGCAGPAGGWDDGPQLPTTPIEENSDLFVDNGDSTFTFDTNDTAYWTTRGYTLWIPKETVDPFVSKEVTVTKLSGDYRGGYGIIICHYDTGNPDYGETMLVVMIRTTGDYMIGEVTGTKFTALSPWTPFAYLNKGQNAGNTVKVDLVSGEFIVSFNGTEATRFRDEDLPYHTHGANGFLVVISPYDNFPTTHVTVAFKEL